jgi:hypothetical protein
MGPTGAETRELLVDRTLSKRHSARSSVVIVPGSRRQFHRGCPLLPPGRLPPAHQDGQLGTPPTSPTSSGPSSIRCCPIQRAWRVACAVGEARPPHDRERDSLRGRQQHQVAGPASGLSALTHGLQAFRRVGESRCVAATARRAARPPPLGERRVAAPSTVVMDWQSVRTAKTVSRATRGWDRREEGRRPQASHLNRPATTPGSAALGRGGRAGGRPVRQARAAPADGLRPVA